MKLIPIRTGQSLEPKKKLQKKSKNTLAGINLKPLKTLQFSRSSTPSPTLPSQNNSFTFQKPNLSPDIFKVNSEQARFKFFTNFSPHSQLPNYSEVFKSESIITPLPKLNYSTFRSFHNKSHQKKTFLKENRRNNQGLSKIREISREKLKKEKIDTKEILKNTIFDRPAETYADKLMKLYHLAMF